MVPEFLDGTQIEEPEHVQPNKNLKPSIIIDAERSDPNTHAKHGMGVCRVKKCSSKVTDLDDGPISN